MSWYIHINKAVRKYHKTRQTFYNYINKWYVDTKKVNNKLFLLEWDIEKVLNDFIPLEWSIVEWSIEKKTNQNQNSDISETNQIWIEMIISWLRENISEMLHLSQEKIAISIEKSLQLLQNDLSWYIENKQSKLLSVIFDLEQQTLQNHSRQKKILFWVYYLVFVSINIFVLWYIS